MTKTTILVKQRRIIRTQHVLHAGYIKIINLLFPLCALPVRSVSSLRLTRHRHVVANRAADKAKSEHKTKFLPGVVAHVRPEISQLVGHALFVQIIGVPKAGDKKEVCH